MHTNTLEQYAYQASPLASSMHIRVCLIAYQPTSVLELYLSARTLLRARTRSIYDVCISHRAGTQLYTQYIYYISVWKRRRTSRTREGGAEGRTKGKRREDHASSALQASQFCNVIEEDRFLVNFPCSFSLTHPVTMGCLDRDGNFSCESVL